MLFQQVTLPLGVVEEIIKMAEPGSPVKANDKGVGDTSYRLRP